ncbi:MAG: L-rhamnose isomerase [Chthoniobacterales bacterium]
MSLKTIESSYKNAKEQYASLGVDTDSALKAMKSISISLHCWQGDDVAGFESDAGLGSTSGIMTTGNYPGRARTGDELRADLDKALSLIPGKHRVNLHAIYAEFEGKAVERDALESRHFVRWLDWAKLQNYGLDFNPTCFSHPKAAAGFTLASPDKGIRDFWIEHCLRSREIAAHFGKKLKSATVNNVWVPDGYKDTPFDRMAPRKHLKESLDKIFQKRYPRTELIDSVEGKLFGIGTESYVAGSNDFYLAYAVSNQLAVCLDAGHYHPTESVADKISSVLLFVKDVLLHVSRGVRWDSDHVVTLTDDLRAIAEEITRHDYGDRLHLGLDFFDASINRIAAWVIGTRNFLKAILIGYLEPRNLLLRVEKEGDYTARLAYLEALKTMPYGAVWEYYCAKNNVPSDLEWLKEVKSYEHSVLEKR